MHQKPKTITTFFRYNVVAILATIIDFLIFILLSEIIGIWYVASTFISAICGGIAAFIFNRNWAFMGKAGKISYQALKYLTVWGGSILLNTLGLYLIVENTDLGGVVSKIIVSVIVGIGYNFLMNKYFVFK